jgi:hypothetical protein
MAATCAAFALAGCIDSAAPILTDSRPLLGPQLHVTFYTLRDGHINEDNEEAIFNWNGRLYAHAAGALSEMAGFSVHPFDGANFIVQTVPVDRARGSDYALMHPVALAKDAYFVVAIDETDADEATRKANCGETSKHACRVSTQEQLWALARATAAHPHPSGLFAVNFTAGPAVAPLKP